MTLVEVVLNTTFLFLCSYMTYRVGYKKGATMVINEWKETIKEMEEQNNGKTN